MPDRDLMAIMRPAVRAALPDTVLKQERANQSVVQQDNSLSPQALSASLPWAARDVRITGALGAGLAFRIGYPQATTIRRWEVRPGTAATSATVITLQVNGVNASTMLLPAGATSAGSNERIPIPAGAAISVTTNIAGGSADVLFSLFT